ncbi:MAG: TetR/AcrR family transcriptional regulator [Blastocatellia bacterium]
MLEAALKCFSERGSEATSIEMIRDLSGASVGSIYHHFGGKDGIALALYLEGLKQANALALRRLRKARGARGRVRALVTAFVQWVVHNPQWARYVYGTAAVWSTGSAPELRALNEAYFQELEAWFRPYIEKKHLRALPIVAIVAIIYGPAFAYARRWLLGETPKSLKALTDEFADAAWRGVRAP